MKNFHYHLKSLFKKIILVVILFQLSRLIFLLFNLTSFNDSSPLEILKIFVIGTRFDLTAIILIYFPLIILYLIPGNLKNNKTYQITIKWLFVILTALVMVLNLVDVEYFKYTNKRSTADFFDLFGLGKDIITLMPQFLKDFWYLFIFLMVIISITWYFYPAFISRPNKTKTRNVIFLKELSALILLCFLLIIVARGIQYKPIRIISAVRYTTPNNIPLILNTPFTIIKTLGSNALEPNLYFSEEKSREYFNPRIKLNNQGEFKNLNVVIIILESFSKEFIGALNKYEGFTPFLDSIINNGFTTGNSYANGKKSIESLPAILSGIPALMDDPYISSPYSTNSITSIASILKTKGYGTSFFHGGANGTMGFDNYIYAAGIDNYYGKNEYPNKDDYDGNWGIFDEEYLQYYANKLSEFKEPFFSCVFTLSSHHPYTIPEKYKGKFKKGNLDIHETISYADFSLKRFFNSISDKPWFQNTLFVITADHTSQTYHKYYTNEIGKYSVPIIYYNPGDPELKGYSHIVSQQTDIMPSVLDYLNFEGEFMSFGSSIFDSMADHFAINYLNGVFRLIEGEYSLVFDGKKSIKLYDIRNDSLLNSNYINLYPNLQRELENKIKSIIQNYNNHLLNNTLNVEDK